MAKASEPHHKETLLRMACGENGPWLMLRIWDGRYAAFWKDGFDIDHCIAVAEHFIDKESDWPFAFLSESREEVEEFINDPANGIDGDGDFV